MITQNRPITPPIPRTVPIQCGDDQCDKEATYGHLEGEAQYCGTHYLPNMVDVTLGTSRRRRPSRKAEEEDSEEALPPRKPSPAENEQASTGKEKKKAMKIVSGSTPSPGTGQVRHP